MPFITPPSKYVILGSNIKGGDPNLVDNNGINNIALGNFVLTNNDNGDANIAIGNSSLNANIDGDNSIAIGVSAGLLNQTSNNVLIGHLAGSISTALHDSVYLGYRSGLSNFDISEADNVYIGSNAVADVNNANVLGNSNANVFIGFEAARIFDSNVVPQIDYTNNVGIGYRAFGDLFNDMTNSVAVGYLAGFQAAYSQDSSSNTFVGAYAGMKFFSTVNSIALNMTAIGYRAAAGLNSLGGETVIGSGSFTGNDSDGIYSTTAGSSGNNTVVGSDNITFFKITGSTSYYNNIVVGTANLGYTNDGLDTSVEDSILIGNNINNADVLSAPAFTDKILIGNNIVVTNNTNPEIYIGDPTKVYTSVFVGGVDILAGGGGLAAVATQASNTAVSITSTANDGVSGYSGGYVFDSTSDNATTTSASLTLIATDPTVGAQYGVSLFNNPATSQSIDFNTSLLLGDFSIDSLENLLINTGVSSSYQRSVANVNNVTGAGEQLIETLGAATYTLNVSASDATNSAGYNVTMSDAGNSLFETTSSDGTNTAAMRVKSDAATLTAGLDFAGTGTAKMVWDLPQAAAAANAATIGNTAPAAGLTVTAWIQVTLNGVNGYIPFFS